MRLIAIIPTLIPKQSIPLLQQIMRAEQKPDIIYLFNNSDTNYKSPCSEIHVINFGKNTGVNSVWNKGMLLAKRLNANCCILNDDIQIKPDFFQRIRMNIDKCNTVLCPMTTHDIDEFKKGSLKTNKSLQMMNKKAGWAFTIPNRNLDSILPIDDELFIFFGDDWIWYHTGCWEMDLDNLIYHEIGATLSDPKYKYLRSLMRAERLIWYKIKNHWKEIGHARKQYDFNAEV